MFGAIINLAKGILTFTTINKELFFTFLPQDTELPTHVTIDENTLVIPTSIYPIPTPVYIYYTYICATNATV